MKEHNLLLEYRERIPGIQTVNTKKTLMESSQDAARNKIIFYPFRCSKYNWQKSESWENAKKKTTLKPVMYSGEKVLVKI